MIKTFARPVPQLCLITGQMTNHIYNMFGRLLTDLDQPWLLPVNLEKYAQAVFEKEAPLKNCRGFIDGTVRAVCRPQENQQVLFNGHKRLHSIKFQSLVAANGMIANMYGPIEGRRHDSFMLRESGLLDQLEQMSVNTNNEIMCIYGDPAYPIRPQLQAPFKGNLSPIEQDYNKAMSEVRVSVEWLFGDILNYFKFTDFKKSQKVGMSAVGKMYLVSALLQNAHTCLYRNTTCNYFELCPPKSYDYFQ
ncbi:uncharacterized protein LOC117120273 [Anneissia japonica]|uniref:uncharacterized protein LOC117120273 n=1 Tax=Anneissia japonica TaxID=1529436 RepID=UPI0014255623|nr:uncharacterized protein LOC117120273 [Anneissia japonica]XP_033121177.1 uncharacterized protein LOC117120273 [Anneissia japonica]